MTVLLLSALLLILYLLGCALFIAETQDETNMDTRTRHQLAALWPVLAAGWLCAVLINRWSSR